MIISDYFVNNGFDVLSESLGSVFLSFRERRECVIIKNEPQITDLGLIIYRSLPIKEQVDFICELIYMNWCEDYLISMLHGNLYYKAYIFCENLQPICYNGCRQEDLFSRLDFIKESFTHTMLSKIQSMFIAGYFGYRKIIQEIDEDYDCLNAKLKYNIAIEFKAFVELHVKAFHHEIEGQIIKNYNNFINNHYREGDRGRLIINCRKVVEPWQSES